MKNKNLLLKVPAALVLVAQKRNNPTIEPTAVPMPYLHHNFIVEIKHKFKFVSNSKIQKQIATFYCSFDKNYKEIGTKLTR